MSDRTQYWCSGCGEPCWARMSQTTSDHIEGVTGHAFVRTFAPDPAPLDEERFGDAVMAALRLRLIQGATDATYTPREVAEMVGHVIEKRVAALEEPTP